MDIKAVITDARVTMYTVNTFAITLALIGCFQEPQKSSGRRSRSSESDANMKMTVDTFLVNEVIEDLEPCSNSGRLYKFSAINSQKGTCSNIPLTDNQCTKEGLSNSSRLVDEQK